MSHPRMLQHGNAVLIVIDIQEAFRHAIGDMSLIASRAAMAVRGFQILELPMIITEQYPKGLGRTAEEILFSLPSDFEVVEKNAFSACGSDVFLEELNATGAKQAILCGLETHVCVNQTAHDLLEKGFDVHLLTDCVASRFEHDKLAGLEKMRSSGVVSSSMEMALFELMRDSGHEKFKEIQNLIK